MGPDKDSLTSAKNRAARKTLRARGRQRRARRPRHRVCLLKGCGRFFRPRQPLARYCSEACRAEADRWRQWKARRRYRQSPNGKQKRQAQSRRYRARREERPSARKRCRHRREGHPYKFFFRGHVIDRVATRSSTAPVDRPCSGLFPRLPSRAGAGTAAGAALASTVPGPALGPSCGKNGPTTTPIKACRYRPDILHSVLPCR